MFNTILMFRLICFIMRLRLPRSTRTATLFPYTPLFRVAEAPLRCAVPWSGLESVLLEEGVKRRAADPEQLGGAGDVVLGAGEGLANGLAVGLLAGRLEVDGKATLLADAEIEVLGGDELAVGHDDRPLHPVLELADIARPGPVVDRRQRARRETLHRRAPLAREAVEEMLGKQGGVAMALGQRRDGYDDLG